MTTYYFPLTNWRTNNAFSMLKTGSKVLQKMKDNPLFPNPPVPLSNMKDSWNALQQAYNNRRNGKVSTMQLEKACNIMNDVLRTQSVYVTEVAKGNKSIVLSSGFDASKGENTRSVVPSTPTGVTVTSKNGRVCLTVKKPAGATSLCWIIYFGEVKEWVSVFEKEIVLPQQLNARIIAAGKYREVISSIPEGTKITVQVMAQNPAGCSAFSQPVSNYVSR